MQLTATEQHRENSDSEFNKINYIFLITTTENRGHRSTELLLSACTKIPAVQQIDSWRMQLRNAGNAI